MAPPKVSDPLDVNARLYRQIARLLDEMEAADMEERMTFPQRISALIAIGRIQKIFVDLRKGDLSGDSGSEIRKYAAAFARPNAAGRGKAGSRSTAALSFDSGPDDDGDAA